MSLFRFNYSRMIPDASQAAMVSSSQGKAQIGAYSKMIPDASQAAMVSSSHRDTCTSPMWALCPSGQGRMGSRTDLNARAK